MAKILKAVAFALLALLAIVGFPVPVAPREALRTREEQAAPREMTNAPTPGTRAMLATFRNTVPAR